MSQQSADQLVRLESAQATALLRSIGVDDPVTVSVVHEFNHVYQLRAGREVFFLKTHTKAWYRANPQAPANCVIHEQSAWDILARHGVPTPEVVLVATDSNNVFGRPFIITRALTGLVQVVPAGAAVLSLWWMYQIFPFDFGSVGTNDLARLGQVLLTIAAAVGTLVAAIVGIVNLVRCVFEPAGASE